MFLDCLLRELVVAHFEVGKAFLGLFNGFRVLGCFILEIFGHFIKCVDMENISLFVEHAGCGKKPRVEAVMEIPIVRTQLFDLIRVLLFNSFRSFMIVVAI